LLPTILSRVQQIWVPHFSDEEVRAYLTDELGITDENRIAEIVYLSDGNLSEALALSEEQTDDRQAWFREWMTNCYRKNVVGMIQQADKFDAFTREKEKEILEYALRVFRDTLLLKSGASKLIRAAEANRSFVENFSKSFHQKYLPTIVSEISKAHYHIESNVRAKIVFLDLSLTLSQLLKQD
jgi:DNA polymerase-3 subunit delta'